MQIMFLMGGSNIQADKNNYPLYLTELEDKIILEKQINYGKELNPVQFLFCVKHTDIKAFRLDFVISQLAPNSKVIPIHGQTKGAVCSALLGCEYMNFDDELILMAVDDFIDTSGIEILNYFRSTSADAGIIAFNSVHPRYSFARVNKMDEVVELAEKRPISKNALVSFYYFKKAIDFIECAKDVIRKDNPVNESFYISQTLNEMILKQKKVVMYKVDNSLFHPLKTEAQLAQYLTEINDIKESK